MSTKTLALSWFNKHTFFCFILSLTDEENIKTYLKDQYIVSSVPWSTGLQGTNYFFVISPLPPKEHQSDDFSPRQIIILDKTSAVAQYILVLNKLQWIVINSHYE